MAKGNPRNNLFIVIFLRCITILIIDLSLPNILLFEYGYPVDLIGLIIAAKGTAYIIGPIVCKPIVRRLGPTKSLRLYVWLIIWIYVFQLALWSPIGFFVGRIFDGLSMGLLWPSAVALVAEWQGGETEDDKGVHYKKYAMSWNYGSIAGQIMGLFIVFFLKKDTFGFWGGAIVLLLQLPFVYRIPMSADFNDVEIVSEEIQFSPEEDYKPNKSLLIFPISLAFLGQFIYAFSSKIFMFTLPIGLEFFGKPSYLVYLVVVLRQFMQLLVFNKFALLDAKKLYIIFIWGYLGTIITSLVLFAYLNIYMLLILTVVSGLVVPIIYLFVNQILMSHTADKPEKQYAATYEVFSGLGFGFTPLIAGFMIEATQYIMINYLILAGLMALLFIPYIKMRKKFIVDDVPTN